jgi:diguanylate cyclase (GGDEF)-like protein/putative nucleotidyltransferase with HDIG domain
MNPLVTKKSCLKCHAFQGYKVGDIRGGVSVAIPMQPLYRDAFKSSLLVAALFFVIWLAGIIIIHYFIKKTYSYLDEQEQMYEQYIYGLVSIVEKRDTYTAGHSTRVANYAELIAKEMGISAEKIHILHRAGMLHDIGKIAIPDSVFLKPSKLTQEEYKLIQEHVIMSFEILNKITLFDDIKEVVRDHHEHYDGSGYPRGLRGDETPILAQILTLADSFDAMTTDRIYKGRKSVAEALEEIQKLSGKQFNPEIVQAALKALKNIAINEIYHQKPQNMLERERFSYFYKDALTGLYNETSLVKDIHTIDSYQHILWISLKGFHNFNKNMGWSEGDNLLIEIAEILKKTFKKESLLYRFYGDNFLVFTHEEEGIEHLRKLFDNLLENQDVKIEIRINTKAITPDLHIKSLRDVLQKLF